MFLPRSRGASVVWDESVRDVGDAATNTWLEELWSRPALDLHAAPPRWGLTPGRAASVGQPSPTLRRKRSGVKPAGRLKRARRTQHATHDADPRRRARFLGHFAPLPVRPNPAPMTRRPKERRYCDERQADSRPLCDGSLATRGVHEDAALPRAPDAPADGGDPPSRWVPPGVAETLTA